jgi:hypothetical protein
MKKLEIGTLVTFLAITSINNFNIGIVVGHSKSGSRTFNTVKWLGYNKNIPRNKDGGYFSSSLNVLQ